MGVARQRDVTPATVIPMAVLKFLAALALCLPAAAQTSKMGFLDVYFIDVEGGQATLLRAMGRETLLIDTGWAGHDSRDAKRIAAVAKEAGITKIDYVLLTHYHADHVGGVEQLAALMPIGAFIDHGPNRENTPEVTALEAEYQKVLTTGHYRHIVARPGDKLPITGMDVTVVSADGNLKGTLSAGQPNPFCKTAQPFPPDDTENARSLGVQITFGKFRILDLGDLTQDKELALMCPNNTLGHEDVLIVSHHGWDHSSNPAFIQAIAPRVAIMDNGATKGGSIAVLDTLRHSPGLETLWQLHYSKEGGAQHNTPSAYIANIGETDKGYSLRLTADPVGGFTVANSRTNRTKHYGLPRQADPARP